MNSRERVMTAVALGQPDRTPMDFSANTQTQARLYRDLGVNTHMDLMRRLHADIVDLRGVVDPVWRGPGPMTRNLPGGIVENHWGWRTMTVPTGAGDDTIHFCDFALAGCTTVEELAAHRWPSPDWFDFGDFAQRLEPWREFAVMASGASFWQHPSFLRGLDALLMDLAAEPEMANYQLDRFTDFYVAFFDRMFTAAPGRIDILRIADDMGMQDRLLFSSETFEHYMVPRLRRLVDMAHSHGVKVMFHSCGAIAPLIDSIIAAGVDILDPIQVAAKGMEPRFLKSQFGSRICLHGSIDTQYLLPQGTPDEVTRAVREMIATLGAGGGFILAPSHVFQFDVTTANILALYETGYATRI